MKCEECIYDDVCYIRVKNLFAYDENSSCSKYKDKNKIIELPCKVGDMVWVKMNFGGYAEAKVINYTYFASCGFAVVLSSKNFAEQAIPFTEFGKTVFLSKADAENKLKGGKI